MNSNLELIINRRNDEMAANSNLEVEIDQQEILVKNQKTNCLLSSNTNTNSMRKNEKVVLEEKLNIYQ